MIIPRKWSMARPGFLIPVFFLCFFQVSGQTPWQEPAVMAAGGCFVSRSSLADGRFNQAGLAWVSNESLSILHTQPFLIGELGISGLSFQLPLHRGGFGIAFSTFGITGLRHISSWTGYGLLLSPGISAGMGLYVQDAFIGELGHHFGAGCALGIQMKIRDGLILGAHVRHPVSWAAERTSRNLLQMVISTGLSYTFFQTATYHTDLQFGPVGSIRWAHGLEISLTESIKMLLGVNNTPNTITGGTSIQHGHWVITIAAAYCFDTGTSPGCSLAYDW